MSLVDKLLGKKPKSAANLAAEIEAQNAAIAACHTRRSAAGVARMVAIETFDDEAHKAVDETIAAAAREIERREHALVALRAAHTDRLDVEMREAFRCMVAETDAMAKAIDERVAKLYPEAAQLVASLANELLAASYRRVVLLKRAAELGEVPPRYASRYDSIALAIGDLPDLRGSYFRHAQTTYAGFTSR